MHEELADWEKELLYGSNHNKDVAMTNINNKIMNAKREYDDLVSRIGLGTISGRNVSDLVVRAKVAEAKLDAYREAKHLFIMV